MGVAQLVERRVVVADAAGSSPVTHPNEKGPGLIPWVFYIVRLQYMRDLGDGHQGWTSDPVTDPSLSHKDQSSDRSFVPDTVRFALTRR